MRALGVRELTYKLSFLACTVQPADSKVRPRPPTHTGVWGASTDARQRAYKPHATMRTQFGGASIRSDDLEESTESVLLSFTEEEQAELLQMRNSPNLYGRLASSIAPTVFGTALR